MDRLAPLRPLVEDHVAAGYASDDNQPRRRPPGGYGALAGDVPRRKKLSEDEALAYQIRQASSGPSHKKTRFQDAWVDPRQRPSPAQTKPRNTYELHCRILAWLPKKAAAANCKSDLQLLHESHRFLRNEEDDDGSWEARLAKRYYDRLFKEYVICDLSGYKKGEIGFRWRTDAEVVQGRGQFQCGHKRCESKVGLRSYEVDFKYVEAAKKKRALVKVRLCESCAYKLHYRRLKAARKRRRKEEKHNRAKRKHQELGEVEREPSNSQSAASGASALKEEDEAISEDSGQDNGSTGPVPTEEDSKLLERLAWTGPDPEARTREDDMDDYFHSLFA
eukprot:gnl/TRDRNA2_/TRDRNA2_44202_c0_seq1.p1 gnl/TRDRNA2_/TRDRNA2_44202_c0~~gnl/TRDRNA2_/TRDRNA2_44202_c0_seq1.p1  ORF type:complete len:334 (-),score=59.12 gnl/TRDRNA2_/TRDRNA2_44202_c0_seq1:69-1070(-)